MGYDDRDYGRRGSDPASPFGGSGILAWLINGRVYLYQAFGIRVFVHSMMVIFIAFELLLNWRDGYGWQDKVASMSILFVSVLLHEYGHCFAGRSVGGKAEEILMWPLGGLAYVDAPRKPWPSFVTTVFGPLTTLGICVVAALFLAVTLDDWQISWGTLFNPFNFVLPLGIDIGWTSPTFFTWYVFKINSYLFLFNLLPIFPMDGGRMVQEALWPRLGYYRSMLLATRTGMVGCVLLAIAGLFFLNLLLILLGVLFFLNNKRMCEYVKAEGEWGFSAEDEPDYTASLRDDEPTWAERRAEAKEQKRIEREEAAEAARAAEIDRILAKIGQTGRDSLTRKEVAALEAHRAELQKRG